MPVWPHWEKPISKGDWTTWGRRQRELGPCPHLKHIISSVSFPSFPASVRETSWKYCQYIQVFSWPWITFLTPQLSCIWFSFLFSQYWNLSVFKYDGIFNTTTSWLLAVGLLIIQYSLLKFFAIPCPPVFYFFGFVVCFVAVFHWFVLFCFWNRASLCS